MLQIKLVNDQATLNNYFYVDVKEYTPADPLNIFFQILDIQLGNRLIPGDAATLTATFQNSDGTELVKTATMFIGTQDKSMWKVALTGTESNNIVGSNFKVILDFTGNASDIRTGMAYNSISKITFDGEC